MSRRIGSDGPILNLGDRELLEYLKTKAKCRGATDIMYPVTHGSSTKTKAAKAVCVGCPVEKPCGEYALRKNEQFGVWGGLSESERKRIRRARRLAS